jgi:hypothetical protein
MELTLSTVFDHPMPTPGMGWPSGALRTTPRWDPHIELNANGSLGLGSVARQRNSRFAETSDGTMTVTEWAPPNVLGFNIRDGASRVTA